MNKLAEKVIEEMKKAVSLPDDTEILDYLEAVVMMRHWDGTIGRPPQWYMHGQQLKGNTLREAILAHMKETK